MTNQADRTVVKQLGDRLHDWISTAEAGDIIGKLGEVLGDEAMMRIGRHYREGFIAWRFADRREALSFRLLREQQGGTTPDFEIKRSGEILRYESTEIDVPGRRRQDEYRVPRKVERMLFTDLDMMVVHMREVAARKAAKVYENCRGLVIWVNPPAFSFRPEMKWDGLLRGAEPAADAFAEVWAMRGKGSLLWLNGKAQSEVPDEEF